MLGKVGVLPRELAERLAPIVGFRNILVHEYLEIDWDEVLRHLQRLGDLYNFVDHVKRWLKNRTRPD
jgi:uncharacterized protein YutE (UPF0331/DUF86 family)